MFHTTRVQVSGTPLVVVKVWISLFHTTRVQGTTRLGGTSWAEDEGVAQMKQELRGLRV